MPTTPSELNSSSAGNEDKSFENRTPTDIVDPQIEQETELLEGTKGKEHLQFKNGVDYINPGEEDQMEVYGYRRNIIFTMITWFFIIATGGLLRLVFHWLPHYMVRATHSKCSVKKASVVLLIERFQGDHVCYYVEKLTTLNAADVCKNASASETWVGKSGNDTTGVNSTDLAGVTTVDDALKLSIHFHSGHFEQVSSILTFTCKKFIYIWDNDRGEFLKLAGLDTGVYTSTLHEMQGLTSQEQFLRRSVYGKNEINVPLKSFLHLLWLEFLHPFYIIQLFSFCLWLSELYFFYCSVILITASISLILSVIQMRRNQHKLHSTVHLLDKATVIRNRKIDKTDSITSDQLVPGDILVIPPQGYLMSCDAVLLSGTCIVNESMLTGESVPVTKTSVPLCANVIYDTKKHARSTLFCGTKVIQTRTFGNEKVLAVVIRTGFATVKGGLVRTILYPPPVDIEFEQDSYKFIKLMTCVAFVSAIYTAVTKAQRGIHAGEIVHEALNLFTIVVPPGLPAAITIGRLAAQNRLEKHRIYCTEPRVITVSGSIDCICFDKTGTLTEDDLDMWGVVPVAERKFSVPVKSIRSLTTAELLFGMVTCHEISIIDGSLVGDPLDLKMFESTGWTLEEPDESGNTKFSMMFSIIVRPPENSRLIQPQKPLLNVYPTHQKSIANSEVDNLAATNVELAELGSGIGIVRHFPFASSLQRMSVITQTLGATHYDLYCKGSPEMIQSLSRPESVPADFTSVLQHYTSEGYRVIAMGQKQLNKLTHAEAQCISRESAESDLYFLGFIILDNRLKQETTPTIKALNQASIRTVMVTGDNILTALSVARDCGMIQSDMPVIAVTAEQIVQRKPQLYYTRSDHTVPSPMSSSEMTDSNNVISLKKIESDSFVRADGVYLSDDYHKHNTNKYAFAVDGKTWAIIKEHYPEVLPKIATRGAIFARMLPDQKQQLVQELQGLGYYVAMVGDGANDCGALKAAHTGISLSDTESSAASPFTSQEPNISCSQSVIREGRAALITSFSIFKFIAAFSLGQLVLTMMLIEIDSGLTDFEYLYTDFCITSIFLFISPYTPAYDGPLAKKPPVKSLLGTSSLLSLSSQVIIIIGFLCLSYFNLQQYDWYKPYNIRKKEGKTGYGCHENYTMFIMSAMQSIILGITFSRGHLYRKSIFSIRGLRLYTIFITSFTIYLAINPFEWLRNRLELEMPPEMSFRIRLVLYCAAHFIVSLFAEYYMVDYLAASKKRCGKRDIDQSRRKFLAIERDLSKNTKWPPLTQEPSTPDGAVPK
ncbi:polyamine-transporting ATPase 13A3 [Microplitis demolitor]|uniref:polyamine-transporting ATPase 13A3 n=1 Tax=Microplitis demolitor TaxID=69319 RepID=UPI0004CC9BB5|nr:polyamine-transporting ATPase 13A3 [Microplitis demolitor]